jgi:glycosyltransferase involved in cell wall biosynthesis
MTLNQVFRVYPTATRGRNEVWDHRRPLLSVIIPCHDYGQYIDDALRSVQLQSFQDFETIVVDDGSTNCDTLNVMDRIRRQGLKVLRLENVGLSESRNRGISVAKGKYICCLDADDTLESTYFEKCIDLLESNPGIAFAYSHLATFGDENRTRLAEPYNLRLLLNYNHVHATAVFRRDAWEAVGGYDPRLDGYEDWEFWIRLGEAGLRGRLIPEILFNYRRHGLSLIDRSDAKRQKLLARIRRNHEELYSHPEITEGISLGYRDVVVSNPFVNINSAHQYKMGRETCLILVSAEQFRDPTEDQFLNVLRGVSELDFLIVNTDETYRATSRNHQLNAQYNLAAFLDLHYWPQFITNLIRTRGIRVVLIMRSKLAYEWSSKIASSHAHIVDILTGPETAFLALKFDPYIECHLVLSKDIPTLSTIKAEKVKSLSTNVSFERKLECCIQSVEDIVRRS